MIDTVFPEFHTLMGVLHKHVVTPLISRHPAERSKIPELKIGEGQSRGETFESRIKALPTAEDGDLSTSSAATSGTAPAFEEVNSDMMDTDSE